MVDFDTDELPWPRKGDDPYALIENSRLIASVNVPFDEPWGVFAEGFKRLADLGVAHIEQTGRSHNFLVYPVFFSYRHYIELSLKAIIRSARQLLDKQGTAPKTHNLSDLWNTAQPLLKEIGGSADLRDVRECMARFDEFDPTSESFRYPVKRSGDAALPDDLRNLDLGQVRDVAERLGSFLEAVATQTSAYLDFKGEMERAYDGGCC
jgi:hypothetical protein